MSDPRPDPDALLASVQADEAKRGRGALRVYLGMCPGVGKTFTMLEDARAEIRRRSGVVVGVVETHGRAETASLLDGLEVLPRRPVSYRGVTLEEFDLDAALARKPALVLVDELAHTNTPGSRHPKRWHDVEELLDAGIDVWTTLNVQHVESRRDAVRAATGVNVQESVPDSVLDLADEIRVIDLTPEALAQRLREGRVYLGDRAEAAQRGFFTEGNLTALREMALRVTAEHVDRALRDYRRANLSRGPWKGGHRLMVAVGPSPYGENLIRLTRRHAAAMDATWIAVHIDLGTGRDAASESRLAGHLALARQLGAEIVYRAGTDLVESLLDVARREGVTQIVAGRPAAGPWWRRWWSRSATDRLSHHASDVDVLIVHPEATGRPSPQRAPAVTPWREYGVASALLVAATLLGFVLERTLGGPVVPLALLSVVTLAGLKLSRWPVLALSIGLALSWNFFFIEPRHTFAIRHVEDTALFGALLLVASAMGHLTTRLRRREDAGREGERRTDALYRLTRVLAATLDTDQALNAARREVEHVFGFPVVLLLPDPQGGDGFAVRGTAPLTPKQLSVATLARSRGKPAGRFTDTLPETDVHCLPLVSRFKPGAVLVLLPPPDAAWTPQERDLLESFAAHITVILEKDTLMRGVHRANLEAASQKLQRALLDNVSHELQTPVTAIASAAEGLSAAKLDPASEALVRELRDASARLGRAFTAMVSLAKLESGMVKPEFEWCDAADLAREAVASQPAPPDVPPVLVEAPEHAVSFRADPRLLTDALGNLVHNAMRHGRAGKVTLRVAAGPDGVRFSVSDEGPGLPGAAEGEIFERFRRGGRDSTGGLGLGLSIAKAFVEAQGGTLHAAPRQPQGAEFTITMPLDRSASPQPQP